MARIDMNRYIFTGASNIFDLQGRCWHSERDKGVPCRIKVGPRRWLNEYVRPEELAVTIWQEEDDRITYLPNEPVQTSVDKNGILTVDMEAFAKEYFGKENLRFCSSETWRWYKERTCSDTFLITDHGIATSRSAWLDINVTHSDLYLMPGTLKLCGHDVRHIYWETFCDELGAHSETVRPLTEDILGGPHTVSAEDVLRRLENLKYLQNEGFNDLYIRTDRGEFNIGVGLNRSLSVRLKDEGQVIGGYEPNIHNKVLEDVDILMQMLQASNRDEMRAKVEDLHQKGLLVARKRK